MAIITKTLFLERWVVLYKTGITTAVYLRRQSTGVCEEECKEFERAINEQQKQEFLFRDNLGIQQKS